MNTIDSFLEKYLLNNQQIEETFLKLIKEQIEIDYFSYKKELLKEVILKIDPLTISKDKSLRLSKEFEIISNHKENSKIFETFVLFNQIYNIAKKNNIILSPGRGSYPSSLILYFLGISMINPLDYDLSFDRFINNICWK